MNRIIVLDCETTGLDPQNERIIEIGCVELLDMIPTGNELQLYFNPGKKMNEEVINIHGITNEFLENKPFFSECFQEFYDFIGNGIIVAHNADFDKSFLDSEFRRLNKPILTNEVVDTLKIARQLYGTGNSLDNLCKRYGINSSIRKKHGALLDAQLLSKVYFFLLQDYNETFHDSFCFSENTVEIKAFNDNFPDRSFLYKLSDEEELAHETFMSTLK